MPRHNISIRDALSGKSEAIEAPAKIVLDESEILPEEENTQGQEQDFDQESLNSKLIDFAKSIQADRPRMAIALESRQPKLKPEFEVEIFLENSTLHEDFNANFKSQLQVFLRKELRNDSIKVVTKIEEVADDSKRKMFTTEEKFQFLMTKNPAVARMKQQFNLELE